MHNTILFTSDIHLMPNRPDLLRLFEIFISEHAIQAKTLYLLGDLFETWIGDDNHTEFNNKVATLISTLTQNGVEVFFMPGNRDFLLGKDYCQQCDMQLLKEPTVITHAKQKYLLSHGDIFCTDDLAYQRYRSKIQSDQCIKYLLKLPLWTRKLIAHLLRQQSQKHLSQDILSRNEIDANISTILKSTKEYDATLVIHGHTHLPGIDWIYDHHQNIIKRFVLSDWNTQGHYLKIEDDKSPIHCYFGCELPD